jgi:hypothetical protein
MPDGPKGLKPLGHGLLPFLDQFAAHFHEYIGLVPLDMADIQSALPEDVPVI